MMHNNCKLFINQTISVRKLGTQVQTVRNVGNKWKSIIGLEVHAQISSVSKLFSGSKTTFAEPINTTVSYFDAAIPGTLPVLNKACVEAGVKTALALGCNINEVSMFDRKHYFYADLPAGYQITQQRAALANNGIIKFPVITPNKKIYYKTVHLLQLQLEQDSGKSLHDNHLNRSLVDLNRAGVPLMELVFAPDLENGEEAASLVKELILIFKRLQTCSCKMEEGALRVDANVSVHQEGQPLGVRTEIKNIGSVRNVAQAISYEIDRQLEVVANGGIINNETRSWDAENRCTLTMRDKEVLQDYRFMPEPNLPPLRLNMLENVTSGTENFISVATIRKTLTELPEDTRNRLITEYQLQQETAIIFVNEPTLLEYFLSVASAVPLMPKKVISNFLINDLLQFCNKLNINIEDCKLNKEHLRYILESLNADEINLQGARKLIELLHAHPENNINELIAQHNLQLINDATAIEELCRQALKIETKAVESFKKGKPKAFFAIVGQVAKLSSQRANMKSVTHCLERLLKSTK